MDKLPKKEKRKKKKLLKAVGFFLFLLGIGIVLYVFFPLISWQIYFANSFDSQDIAIPIPKTTVVESGGIESLVVNASNSISGIDYTDASNWFPNYKFQKGGSVKMQFYSISIPKLKIKNASVSTTDTDLSKHLVNYFGTSLPPEKGNAVVFGHSTLPQLYDEKNYKTIFTNLYKLTQGDEIIVTSSNSLYKYRVESVTVVDPENTTVLEQNYDDSFLTLVTCTPPGTIWKRLVVKARIEKV
ncbi:MAG TPA: sortase [Candidatus Sulfotelmatobacter sp.]|nr:sortase [Candidatus Sulfotelmatobacter sp.]